MKKFTVKLELDLEEIQYHTFIEEGSITMTRHQIDKLDNTSLLGGVI